MEIKANSRYVHLVHGSVRYIRTIWESLNSTDAYSSKSRQFRPLWGSPQCSLSLVQKLVENISSGKFDIHFLAKLHRDEEPRNANVKKTTEGLHIPVDGGKPQIVTGRTKMLDTFPNMAMFSSAWMIYVSIRSSYDLERGPPLSYWMERLVHYYQRFEWSACLDYAIAYFMKHQNASREELQTLWAMEVQV